MTINHLANWLSLELAATLYGSKPSTILTIRDNSCFPVLMLWRKYGETLLQKSIIKMMILKESEKSMTILFYRPVLLDKWLRRPSHKIFMKNRGYSIEDGIDGILSVLYQRFQGSCPHEIGLILGIPLKDVIGFIEARCPHYCKGQWKVYGCFETSIRLMKRFNEDREMMQCLINKGVNTCNIFCCNTRNLLDLRIVAACG